MNENRWERMTNRRKQSSVIRFQSKHCMLVSGFIIFLLYFVKPFYRNTSLSNNNIRCQTSSDNSLTETKIEVKYEIVEDVHDTYLRFEAFYKYLDNSRNGGDEWNQLSIQQWVQLLSVKDGQSVRLANELTQAIVESCPTYDAFFFETKGTSSKNAFEKQFEFVLVNAPSLYRFAEGSPNPDAFKEYCTSSEVTLVCSFWNFGKDAMLIAPVHKDEKDLKIYSHMAAFLRGASHEAKNQMWSRVTNKYLEIMKQWDGKSVWLSTSGLGVAWLHFRLDQKPKYYTFKEFKETS